MKFFAIAAISILASVQLCSADLIGNFIGTWTQDGVGSGTKIITVFQRYETKGLVATTTYIFPGITKSVAVTRYYDSGRIKGYLKRDGAIQSKLTGTWSVSGRSLYAKTKVSAPVIPIFSENVTTTLVSANKIGTVSKSSNGVRSSGSMTRRK